MTKSPQQLYEERLKRITDAIQLKMPDRVPIAPVIQQFPYLYSGLTMKEAMYEYSKAERAWDKFLTDFEPDLAWGPVFAYPAKAFDILDIKWFRWPGHGIPPNKIYQFVEGEYMKAKEYDEFIYDPTNFMLRKWLPRAFGRLQGLQDFPMVRDSAWMGWFGSLLPFCSKNLQETFKTLKKAGDELDNWTKFLIEYNEKMKERGFPAAYGGSTFAPFDMIGDTLRGTRGILTDMIRYPEKLLKAIEKMIPIAIEMGASGAKAFNVPFVYIWLHKGCEGFMSQERYNTFYWPGLRNLILGLIEQGLTPCVYSEGGYTERLETIRDVPKGKLLYHFENVDMTKAKEVLGDVACISGNVPNTLLISGTPREVEDYCRNLIDTVGKDGGFIMDSSALIDEAKPENLKKMFQFTKEYG